jgi:exonuclease VII small subunit
MSDSIKKFKEDNEVESLEQTKMSLEDAKERIRQAIQSSQSLQYDLNFSADAVMDILNNLEAPKPETSDEDCMEGQLNLSHREIVEEIISDTIDAIDSDIRNLSGSYIDTKNCSFDIYNGNEIELNDAEIDFDEVADDVESNTNADMYQDIIDNYCGVVYPFEMGDKYYKIIDNLEADNHGDIVLFTWDEEARKNHKRNMVYFPEAQLHEAREHVISQITNSYYGYFKINVKDNGKFYFEKMPNNSSKPYGEGHEEGDVYLVENQAKQYIRSLLERYPENYPFKEGDEYYTIEHEEVVSSCWDEQSEDLYKRYPTTKYYATKEEAEQVLADELALKETEA